MRCVLYPLYTMTQSPSHIYSSTKQKAFIIAKFYPGFVTSIISLSNQ